MLWLEGDFLSYLDESERCVVTPTELTATDRSRLCLSHETLEGLQITGVFNYKLHLICIIHNIHIYYTVKPLVELTGYVLQLAHVYYLLSVRLCPDPLETLQKPTTRGGHCDNPTMHAFIERSSSLRVQGSVALEPVRGNFKQE